MPSPAFLAALLMAKADDDAESVAELRDVMADGEHAGALLEQVTGEGDAEQPDAPPDRKQQLVAKGYKAECTECGGGYYYNRTDGPKKSTCEKCGHEFDARLQAD